MCFHRLVLMLWLLQLSSLFRNPLLFVTIAFDLPSLFSALCVGFRAVIQRPVWVVTMGLVKNLLCPFYEILTGHCDVERFGGIDLEIVDFNGLVDAVSNGFPIAESGCLDWSIPEMKFPLKVVSRWRITAFEVMY